MKVLVTGGAGYIGSHLVKLLKSTNHEVHIVDNLSTGSLKSIVSGKLHEFDLKNTDKLTDLCSKEQFDAAFHFAGKIVVPESIKNPIMYYQENVANTLNLLKCCSDYKINRFIFSSTAAVYKDPGLKPVDENSVVEPLTPYGQTKLTVEKILKDMTISNPNFKAGILRYFNVAGADLDGIVGPRFKGATHLIKKCFNAVFSDDKEISIFGTDYNTKDGTGVRDFIHVSDLAMAHLDVLEFLNHSKDSYALFNCGYGQGYSVKEVIKCVEEVTDTKLNILECPRREGDLGQVICSNEKILNQTQWKPKFNSLKTIISSVYEWEKKIRNEK